MHESDPPASGTGAWRVVDEAIAGGPAGGERRVEVGHSVAHMMDSRPPTSEKSRDGAVRISGRKQLDLGLTEGQGNDGGAIRHLGRVRLDGSTNFDGALLKRARTWPRLTPEQQAAA